MYQLLLPEYIIQQITTNNEYSIYVYYSETFYCLFFWFLYYCAISDESNLFYNFIRKLPQEKRIEGNSRIISSTHAMILSFFSTLYLIDIIDYEYWITFLPICSSFGLFDLTLVTIHYSKFKKNYVPIFIHHSLLVFGPLLVTHPNSYVMAQSFLFENTVPILDFSWYLYHTNHNESLLFKVNAVVGLISFFLFRIVNNFYLLTQSVQFNSLFQLATVSFMGLNIYWFYSLVKLFMR